MIEESKGFIQGRMETSLTGKVCIVTGSNTGIGKETARGFLDRGATVILACRDEQKARAAASDLTSSGAADQVQVMPLDLGDTDSIRTFAKTFASRHQRLDVLVNNAGVWTTKRSTTAQGFETTFGVNHLGTFLLTNALLPTLKQTPKSRIVVLSSSLHYRGAMAWDDLQAERRSFSGPAAYNQSKLANVLFTKALARRLKDTGVTVNAVHPGVVATELARDYPKFLVKLFHLFLLTPAQGAKCSVDVAIDPQFDSVTGEYFEKSKTKKASSAALDVEAQERLWSLSEKLLS
jgi:NAD(P)-dependent dehydrogenase (short-subunit alcohol dehydrogenase family)